MNRRLFWFLLALVPIAFGLIDLTRASQGKLIAALIVTGICCLTAGSQLLKGHFRGAAYGFFSILLAALLFVVDISVGFFVGCTTHPFRLG